MDKINYNIKKVLRRRTREERTKRNWTIEQLAEKADLSPSFLGCVERGERALSIEKLYTMSEVFEVTCDSLIKEQLPQNSKTESMMLLVKELDESEFTSVYKIAQTAIEQFKNK